VFGLRYILRNRQIRLLGGRATAFAAAVLLVVPSFACHCSDGHIQSFCLPGHCTSCCRDSAQHSCCRARTCCEKNQDENCGHGNGYKEATAGKLRCCHLVIGAPTPATTPVAVDFVPSQVVDSWLVSQLVDLLGLAIGHRQQALADTSPPPIDLVITQLRLTI